MKWNEPYTHVETITIPSPKRIITAPRRYNVGLGDLTVYVNGFYAIRDKEYKEITAYSIEFVDELEAGDVIALHYQKLW